MKTHTIDDIIALNPCERYQRERIDELFAGREELTTLEILDLDIQACDRIWAVVRLVESRVAVDFAMRVATRALETHALHCGIESAEEWAAKWISGVKPSIGSAFATTAMHEEWEEMTEARAAAISAVWAAVWAAEWAVWAAEAAEREIPAVWAASSAAASADSASSSAASAAAASAASAAAAAEARAAARAAEDSSAAASAEAAAEARAAARAAEARAARAAARKDERSVQLDDMRAAILAAE